MNLTILGGGSWGTALAIHLAKSHHSIKIWEFVEEQAREMQQLRICRLLPGSHIPDKVFVTSDMKQALTNAELIFIVVPSDKVESTLDKAKGFINNQSLIICSKGFASDGRLLSEVVRERCSGEIYCLYGPTHAEEVCKGILSGIVLAGGAGKEKLKPEIENEALRVALSEDVIGVQVAAALKNVLAVMVGIIDGLGMGDNTKALAITCGLQEITQIGVAMGAQPETFTGLAGLGDTIVTCMSRHSRNRHVGEQLGKGRKLDEIMKEMKMVAEGVTAVKHAQLLAEEYHLTLPLLQGTYQILFENKEPLMVLKEL